MKISLITITYNSAKTIEDTLKSVANQTYDNIEHIIIDGQSKDNTLIIISQFPHIKKVISEPDEGIYDAMNKGIKQATGDVVGILNSDDFYPNESILGSIAKKFQDSKIDAVFGDIIFVDSKNLQKKTRYYSAKNWSPKELQNGFMPPHPSFFVRREFYEKFGLYKTNYKIAADFELIIRFLNIENLRYKYIDEALVYMREGGVSNKNIKSRLTLNREIVRACKENGLNTNLFRVSLKYMKKIKEYYSENLN